MPSKRPPRPQSSPLLKALRLADRRARRGVLPSAALLAEWQASVDAALHEGSAEAPELRLRLAEIGALVFGQVASRTAIPEVDRREREIGRWWQAVFDAPQRGTLGELAERVAGHLARLPHPRRSTRLTPPRQPAMLGAPAPLPTTLTDEPDAHALRSNEFFLARQALTNGWLERMGLLARYGMQPGSYSFLDMPLVYDTDLELDWVEGEPDPFEEPRVIGPARQMAERMAAKGARVQLRRGREVPVDAYEPSEARAAEELLVVGAYGPVSLGSLSVLDQAVPVEERSGLLHLILAPGAVEAAKSLPVADVVTELDDLPPEERRNARPEETGPRTARRPESLPDETPDTPTFPSTTTGLELQGGERSEVGVARSVDTRASAARPTRPIVQVALDWVSGEDPWQTPEIIAEALTRLQVVASGAANVEIVRGRELPFERYAPAQAQAAADLVLLGPGHALPLAGVALLEGAVVELQRPGFLQVLIAPGAARTTRQPARPDPTSGRDYPELALAYEDEVAASEAPGDSGEVVRRVSWTGDLVPPEVSPAKIGQVAETRSQPPREVVPPATFGLLGVQSSEVPALGLGNTLGAATEPEPLAAPARVQPMRVIDRQTELRRAEWAREAQALDDSQSPASASAPSLAPTRPTSPLIPSVSGPALDLAGPAPLDLPLVTEAAADEPAVAAEGTRTPVARQPVGEPPTTRAGEATAPVAGPSITPLGSTPGGTAVPPVSDTTAEVRSSVQRDEGQPGIPAPDQRPEAPSAERRPDAEPVGEWPGVQRAGEPATARRADEPAAGERSVEPSLAVEAPAALTTPGEAVPSPRPTDVEEPVRPSAGENVEFQTAEQVPTGGASQPSEVEAVPSVIVAREAGEVAPEVVPPAISSEPSVAQVVPVAAAEVDRAEARPVAYPDASTADVVAAEEGTVRGEPATAASTGGSSPAATGNFASGDDRAAEPAPLPRAPAGETIRLTIDWVSGEDPWADPRRLEPAREALRALADQGIKVELTRGREVPIGQYDSAQAQRAADFQMLTAAGPILLTGVDLLDAAVLVAQRPGALEVLLAPRTAAPATPGEQYRNIPELPLVLPEEPAEPGEEPATPTVRHDAPTPGRSDSVAARSVDPSAPALQSTSASPAPSDATASADVPSPIAPAEAPLLDPGHASVETPAAASRPAPRAEARDDASFEVPPVPGAVTAAEGMTLG
ncbi:MAG TPA: hypothetical protein VFZ25_10040, partial [Chloroflexota bacterium]|nr:hypothetical protein [Chloroflexota bacterium]